jgi:hypothetical protein
LLRERLARYCAASGVSERAVVEAALGQYLDASGDLAVLLRRFDRVDRALAAHGADLELVGDALGGFVRIWLEARASGAGGKGATVADGQYRDFLERLAQRRSDGRRFRDELPETPSVGEEGQS